LRTELELKRFVVFDRCSGDDAIGIVFGIRHSASS
jgi:hypothetical protein